MRAAGRLWGGEAGDDQGTRPSPEGTHARSVAHRISCSFTTSLVTTTRTRDRQPRSHVSRGTSSRPKWTWLSLCVHSCRSTAVWATCPSSLQEAAAPHQLGPPASFPALLLRTWPESSNTISSFRLCFRLCFLENPDVSEQQQATNRENLQLTSR